MPKILYTRRRRATLRPPPRYAAADHRQGLISPTHLRRSDRIRHAKKLISLVFTIPELFLRVISQLDWHDLMRIAKVSKHGQACVRVQISDRIRYLLDRWIPAIHMQDFLNALNRSGAVVVGSVARRLFSLHCEWYEMAMKRGELHTMDWSYDLNIVAPAGRAAECRAFFQSIGYDTWLSEEVACHYHGFASGMERGYMCREDGQSNEVTITEATGGVVPVVVASPTTCQLNMFSSTTLFTFVPLFITKYMGMRTDITSLSYHRRPHPTIILYPSNKQWEGKTASLLISVSPAGGGSGKRANIVLDLYIGSTGQAG
ncbi:hypothetical protein BKA70DRAFT_1418485 [Coprinopsis sp. MPI-PUGE-AT-0042]|nr:hypothetical protein BKA70DRAFT_1451727 [Coprinopsis sp. MPI-PUGE-AT-0042]KAH6874143.1 hypothetical protein BKA70DRAFT_1449665 [Coprinopsis sp. MPI-PUGE-AT-0042]KAH6876771.1 hypothetical protein BKA70DRAFT_1448536 [Coprinopsis sp. MPI-PUGE-AT-0042]KAH6876774.1 hypothetical protein BKA70DRAFT_1448411 [Coprinopsis sp. MPI-PUGE-AT-0042]KAH6879644.1 hypothetical protein BKA70DRAFT_1447804 [Coprinopsis sp. MPI-PUGE-AT-0042]